MVTQYKAGRVDFTTVSTIEQNLVVQQNLYAQSLGQIDQGLIQVYRARRRLGNTSGAELHFPVAAADRRRARLGEQARGDAGTGIDRDRAAGGEPGGGAGAASEAVMASSVHGAQYPVLHTVYSVLSSTNTLVNRSTEDT